MTHFKRHELTTAALLGGKRNTRDKGHSAVDVTHAAFAVECKTRKIVPAWLTHGMTQAKRAATEGQLPIVVIHQHGTRYLDDLIVISMADFRNWFGEICQADSE